MGRRRPPAAGAPHRRPCRRRRRRPARRPGRRRPPARRMALKDVAGDLAGLLRAAPARAGRTRVLAIDGRSGAGKSTLAALVAGALGGAPVVSLESLYGGWDGLRRGVGLLVSDVLAPLAAGRPVRVPRYDWVAGVWREPVELPRRRPVRLPAGVAGGRRPHPPAPRARPRRRHLPAALGPLGGSGGGAVRRRPRPRPRRGRRPHRCAGVCGRPVLTRPATCPATASGQGRGRSASRNGGGRPGDGMNRHVRVNRTPWVIFRRWRCSRSSWPARG